MSYDRVAAVIGSGTVDQTRAILPAAQRGKEELGEGVRTGLQVMVANFEDNLAVDAFAASGITVGTSAVEIISPGANPLPRCRQVIIENTGGQDVLLSHKEAFTDIEGFELSTEGTAGASRRVTLPLLHNVSVWARTTSGSTTIKLLIV